MKKYFLFIGALFFAAFACAADYSALSLETCSRDALNYSNNLKQLQKVAQAAQNKYESANAAYYPSLSFDAQGGWVSQVPSVSIGPESFTFGDKWSYSVGPAIEYILFDYKGRSGAAKSAQSAYRAAQDDYDFAKKTLLLNVRQAYFTVQGDLENIYLSAGQLKVAQKQLADIQAAFKAGAKSSLDVSMALKQELRARVNISIARGALGAHLRDLFKLTGSDYGINPLYPADWRVIIDKEDKPATARVKADSIEDTLKKMAPFAAFKFDENISKLASLENLAQYYENLAQSLNSSLYPSLSVRGGAYWEYPNGPIRENIFLGRAAAAIHMPLFEGGKTRGQVSAQKNMAAATQYQKLDTKDNLQNIFDSSKNMLYALDAQAGLTKKMIETAQKAAALTYDAYKAGTVTFLEVDNANLALLESRISLANIYIQTLNRLAVLDNLGRK